MKCRIYRHLGTRCCLPRSFSNVGLGPICPPLIRFLIRSKFMKMEENVIRLVIEYVYKMQFQNFGTILGQSVDRDLGRDTVLCNNIFLKLIAPPFALWRAGEETEEARLSSDSLLLPMQAETSSPMHVPAVAVPAVRQSNWVRKLPVRFAP
jgi:hypothetical protein